MEVIPLVRQVFFYVLDHKILSHLYFGFSLVKMLYIGLLLVISTNVGYTIMNATVDMYESKYWT